MRPRIGLYVALVGLVMAGLTTLTILMNGHPFGGANRSHAEFGGFVLFFGAIFGLIVMVVGLALAGVLALIRQAGVTGCPFWVASVLSPWRWP
jgi:hypothetical protein